MNKVVVGLSWRYTGLSPQNTCNKIMLLVCSKDTQKLNGRGGIARNIIGAKEKVLKLQAPTFAPS